jgi:hypothetical protein
MHREWVGSETPQLVSGGDAADRGRRIEDCSSSSDDSRAARPGPFESQPQRERCHFSSVPLPRTVTSFLELGEMQGSWEKQDFQPFSGKGGGPGREEVEVATVAERAGSVPRGPHEWGGRRGPRGGTPPGGIH